MSAEAVSPAKQITIYALTDPDTGEVRYIGRTKDVWKRYGWHLMMLKGSAAKHKWFADLQQRQQLPVLKILEEPVDPSEAKGREQWWIVSYHGQGANLVNGTLLPKPPKPAKELLPTPILPGSLVALLQSHGILRPADLKALLGIQRQYAWQLWHGVRQFTPEQALKLFDVYGVPMDELYRAERPPESSKAPKGRPRKPPPTQRRKGGPRR